MITKEAFTHFTGKEPIEDDLDRCNCKEAGTIAHECCGWCLIHMKPQFMCMCYIKHKYPTATLVIN